MSEEDREQSARLEEALAQSQQLIAQLTDTLAQQAKTFAKISAAATPVPQKPSKPVVKLLGLYLDNLQVTARSKASISASLAPAARHFADRPADECNRADWLHWRDHVRAKETTIRKDHPQPFTLNLEIKRWRGVYRWGIEESHCATNPLATIKTLKAKKHRHTSPSESDLMRLLSHCSPMLAAFVLIAARTGMRSAEIRKLAWREIDLAGARIVIPWERTKTRKERTVPLTADVVSALQIIRPEVGGKFVFENPESREPYSYTWVWLAFREAVDRAKLEPAAGDGRVVGHDLRHKFMGWAAGIVPLPVAIAISGHSDLRSASRYIQISNKQMEDARDELDKAVRKGPRKSDENKAENPFSEIPSDGAKLGK